MPGRRLLSLPNFSAVVNAESRAALEARLPSWVGELIQRGVAERKARQLALDIADDQPVSDQIEYADHLIQQDRAAGARSPIPRVFIYGRLRIIFRCRPVLRLRGNGVYVRTRSKPRMASISGCCSLSNEYEEYCEQETSTVWKTTIRPSVWTPHCGAQMKIIRREQPEWFGRIPDPVRREVAISRLRAAIRTRLNLPSFEEWRSLQGQRPLF